MVDQSQDQAQKEHHIHGMGAIQGHHTQRQKIVGRETENEEQGVLV